jgi:hypothetical protein
MTCPDYPLLFAERNSHTAEFFGKVWPGAGRSGMLRPEASGPGSFPMIAFGCPKCKARLEFADSAAGRIVRCPECRVRLRLPGELTDDDPPRRKKRRRRLEQDPTEPAETPEWLAPAIILGLALTLSVGSLAVAKGQEGAAGGIAHIGLRLLTAIPLSIGGMFIVAPLLGITFGTIGMAVLKLAAINVLTLSIVLNVELAGGHAIFGYALAAPIVWLLFKWLFALEFSETMIALTVIDLIQFLANLTVTAVTWRAGK